MGIAQFIFGVRHRDFRAIALEVALVVALVIQALWQSHLKYFGEPPLGKANALICAQANSTRLER